MNNSNNSPPNTMFSSSSCKYCQIFLKELNKSFLINEFSIIDVEKTAFDVSKVKVVPTIIVENTRALSGRDAFSWLQNQVKNAVVGVETSGISSVFSFIENDSISHGQCVMTQNFAQIEDISNEAPAPDTASIKQKTDMDISSALARLKQERSA
tara:strand:- start:717 stop:1178 length:462 start_codon:yes stop_codon:yes gene_type:complete